MLTCAGSSIAISSRPTFSSARNAELLEAGSLFQTPSSELPVPKITDFGLVKRMDVGSDLSKSGAVMGTPAYMAPEQAAGKVHDTGPGADVYALGTILYECLTGRPPFQGKTPVDTLRQVLHDEPAPPSRLAPKVPGDLETICLKCLEKEPSRRYRDAEELDDDLARYRSGEPILARAAGRLERAVKWARRRPAVAALLLVTLIGVAGIVWKYLEAEHQKGIAERLADDFRTQKEAAERAEQAAKDEAKHAAAEEARAKRELTRAEGLVYAGNLTQAQLFWQEANAEAARERLDACRWDYRGWEHAHLRNLFDESCVTLKGHTDPDGESLGCGGRARRPDCSGTHGTGPRRVLQPGRHTVRERQRGSHSETVEHSHWPGTAHSQGTHRGSRRGLLQSGRQTGNFPRHEGRGPLLGRRQC